MNAPLPYCAASPGKRRKLPNPTALPATARITPSLELQASFLGADCMGRFHTGFTRAPPALLSTGTACGTRTTFRSRIVCVSCCRRTGTFLVHRSTPANFAILNEAALINSLRSCKISASLPPNDLQIIAGTGTPRSLDKGDYLFREGDPPRGFYLVQHGTINVHRVNAAGKEQVICVFRTGNIFAEAPLATDSGYPADARAVKSSAVLFGGNGGPRGSR